MDLGINTDAVCTIMRADGTVLGRKFIDHPSEKDRMYRTLGRIRRFQREHGSAQSRGRWAYTKRLNTEMGRKNCRCDRKICRRKPCGCDRIRISGNAGEDIRKEKSRNCICGENGISRSVVNIRHTEKECAYPESVHGIQAGLRMMVLEMYPVTRRITVFVYSRQENNITVTCRHRIISGQDILSENF
ncbi:hypothetical protein M5E86_06955 [Blautia wexlerae]|nr:hypothetical protein M5E86_06955 [Blautia wexlerae]